MATLRSTLSPAANRILSRITPLTRTIKVGQLGYANLQRNAGYSDVPRGPHWFEVLATYPENHHLANYLKVRCIAPGSRYYSHWACGCVYHVSKNKLHRVDPVAALDFDLPVGSTFPELNPANSVTYPTFCEFVKLLNNVSVTEKYFANRNGHAAQRLINRFQACETRTNTRTWGWMCNRHAYNNTFFKNIKADLKKLGKRVAGYKADMAKCESPDDAVRLINIFHHVQRDSTNRFRYTTVKENVLLEEFMLRLKDRFGLVNAGCGHLIVAGTERHIHDMGNMCQQCYDQHIASDGPLVDAITRDGTVVQALRYRLFEWDDGSLRTYTQPPIIGGYHSNKNTFVKSLPHITGQQPHESVLKVGYELEFVRANRATERDEVYARQMMKRLSDALTPVIGQQPYCGFERDGSVDFEMVSGYGPMDIHRAAIIALLHSHPWAGKLSSHDGGRCGLHVHVDKPKSLMHAVRLQAFYNNPFNEHLIKAVARRYGKNSGYAKIKAHKGDMAAAARSYKNNQEYRRSYESKAEIINRTITSLTDERYEVVNYQNTRTAEIRVFRGSMVTNTVLACLEFAFMSWYFTRDTTNNQLTTDNFLAFISKPEWRHESRYLRTYLWGKGFKVWMPKKQPREHAVEA